MAILFAVLLGLAWEVKPAQAQCGDIPPRSACITCHETSEPVSTDDFWHGVHASKDCCASCHGGNCSTMDKALAHEGMYTNPLEDIYINCHACHPDDYQARAAIIAGMLHVTPNSCATPTPVPVGMVGEHPMMIQLTAVSQSQLLAPWGIVLGGFSFILAFVFFIRWVYCHIRRCEREALSRINSLGGYL